MGGVIKPCALVNPFRTYLCTILSGRTCARGGRGGRLGSFLSRVRATRDAARLCARPGARLPGVARRGAGVRVGVEWSPGRVGALSATTQSLLKLSLWLCTPARPAAGLPGGTGRTRTGTHRGHCTAGPEEWPSCRVVSRRVARTTTLTNTHT